jgi:hypothetical protein
MANIAQLQDFAAQNGFDMTAPMGHDQVVRFANLWLPAIRFYEKERFHPVPFSDLIDMVEAGFADLPEAARAQWRIRRLTNVSGAGVVRVFDPPAVCVPDGFVPGAPSGLLMSAHKVLNDGSAASDALGHAEVDSSASLSHGPSFERSNRFFGAIETLAGGNEAAPGDPFVPRAQDQGGAPRISVHASWKNLLDVLEFELKVDAAPSYPPSALRGFDVAGLLWTPVSQPPQAHPGAVFRNALLELIASHKLGSLDASLVNSVTGWRFNWKVWRELTRFAFLEFSLLYAYNDFDRYQTTPFENEHEGDDEGFCLVFERAQIELALASSDPQLIRRVAPHSIITSVHEEWQDADQLQRFDVPWVPPPSNPGAIPSEAMALTVYVAGGSHATYLSPGQHDLVDFGDTWGMVGDGLLVIVLAGPILVIALLVSILDHFIDTEDFTSDDGIHSGPDSRIEGDPQGVRCELSVVPLSGDRHIYQPEFSRLLSELSFPGKLGGTSGLFSKSSAMSPKTARYFRKLLREL